MTTGPLAASTWVITWLVLGLVFGAVLLAALTQLVRSALSLSRTLRGFRDEVQPLAEEIARESGRAADRTSSLRVPRSRRS